MSTTMVPQGAGSTPTGGGSTSTRSKQKRQPRTHLQPRGSGNAIQQQEPKRDRQPTAPRSNGGSSSGGSTGGTSGRSGGGGGGGGGSTTTTNAQRRQREEAEKKQREAERQQKEAEEERRRKEEERQKQLEDLRNSIQETPLDPDLVAQFAARERAAKRAVEESEIAAQRGREQSRVDFDQFLRQLDQQRGQAVGGLRDEAAARNLAFQPMFVGRGMRDIRDDAAEAQAQAQANRAEFLAGIDRQIDQSKQSRDEEMAAVERERARAQADHKQWINTQLEALQ